MNKQAQTSGRSAQWQRIWTLKGEVQDLPLHHLNGFDLLTDDEWVAMVRQVAGPIGLRAGDRVIECGCGAGAFLAALLQIEPDLRVEGVDYSASLLTRAERAVPGRFYEGDMRDLSFLPAGAYDHVLSFSTFHYLNSADDASGVVREMARLVAPGGSLTVGEVSDAAKRDEALAIRRESHRDQPKVVAEEIDHLYVPKGLFERLAGELGFALNIVDHTAFQLPQYHAARYRFTAYFRKPL